MPRCWFFLSATASEGCFNFHLFARPATLLIRCLHEIQSGIQLRKGYTRGKCTPIAAIVVLFGVVLPESHAFIDGWTLDAVVRCCSRHKAADALPISPTRGLNDVYPSYIHPQRASSHARILPGGSSIYAMHISFPLHAVNICLQDFYGFPSTFKSHVYRFSPLESPRFPLEAALSAYGE